MSAVGDPLTQAQQAFARGDFVRARDLAQQVLAANAQSPQALALLANAANALKFFDAAADALERLRAVQPDNPTLRGAHAMALNNAGALRYRNGDLAGAAARYRRALDIDADFVLALSNLAACAEGLRLHAEAVQIYARLSALQPGNVAVELGRSRALRALAAHAEADSALRAAEQDARTTAERIEVGKEFLRCGDATAAARLLGADDAEDDETASAIARMQAACNQADAARRRYAVLAQRAAGRGDERRRFCAERDGTIVLPQVAADAAALAQSRSTYESALRQLIEQWPPARLQAAGVTLDDLNRSRFLLTYQGGDDRALAERHGDWLAAVAAALDPAAAPPASGRIERIGIVSSRWTQGTIPAYFGTWIGALRAAGKKVYFFAASPRQDAVSAALAAQADAASALPRPLAAAAAELRRAELDLLIYPEVGLDGATEVLAALRLAPRQWAAWGHPVTTGLPTIDRFLSVATMEPPDAALHYREPLALLPGLGTRYARPPRVRDATHAQFGLPDAPLYALPHSPLKLHPDSDALLVAIARRDADACFLAVADEIPALSAAWRARAAQSLLHAGLDPARHLRIVPRLPVDAYRCLLACADVVLDSLHFSGGNTSLDALAQATPVVTIEARFMRGRQTAAMLRLLDAPAMIARDIGEAATIAVDVAHSPDRRRELSEHLDANAAHLFDREEPLQALRELVLGAGRT
jgi:CRISPR-associated protein Csy1